MIEVYLTCRMCNTDFGLKVEKDDLARFQNGEHIQDVMPYLTADERELFISGICGKCFDHLFEGDDE